MGLFGKSDSIGDQPRGERQAILPENREESTLGGMSVGEGAFTVRWAMWVDPQRRCWVDPDYPVTNLPLGTSNMRVERRADGYHVWVPPGATWQPRPRSGHNGVDDSTHIPVVELHDIH